MIHTPPHPAEVILLEQTKFTVGKQSDGVITSPHLANSIYKQGDELSLLGPIGTPYGKMLGSFGACRPQHLYFTENKYLIKEGNWFLSDDRNHIGEPPKYRVEQCIKVENGWIFGHIDGMGQGHNPDWSKLIIATDDPTVLGEGKMRGDILGSGCWMEYHLPKIDYDFCKFYVQMHKEGKPITEIIIDGVNDYGKIQYRLPEFIQK